MKLFGIKIGKKKKEAEGLVQKPSFKKQAMKSLAYLSKYEVVIFLVIIVALLSVTSIRMLRYTDPPVDPDHLAENTTKLKHITIDPKVIENIKQLSLIKLEVFVLPKHLITYAS